MAITTGNDPLSGAPDAGVRGRSAYGAAPSSQFFPSSAVAFPLPDPLADSGQDYMQQAVGPGPSAVSFPPQGPIGGGVAAHPWKVRWHEDENGENGQWEVLSPTANFEGIGACEVMNTNATDTSGHPLEDDAGWYRIGTEGDLNDGDYKVVAHFKAAAQFGDASYRRPAVFVGIESADEEPTDNTSTYAGDYASFIVATIHVETDVETGDALHRVTQFVSTPYTVEMATVGAPCVLGVDCAVSGSTLTVSKFGFSSENVSVAGVSGTVDLELDTDQPCTVWLHAEARNGTTTLKLEKFGVTSSPSAQYSDTDIYVCIYRISDHGTVVGDYRANMQNLPYYR